ncbi:hypothetical protein C0992_006338 [Termitomyces sp. T32_za158]|nr:hypothetical protein C0992_006338 [Termitomyces sp. T32_za158]
MLAALCTRKDILQEVRDGMKAVSIGMEEARAEETGRVVMEKVGRAMDEYKEVQETLAEATVKTVQEMADQARKIVERVEEGQVMETREERGSKARGGGGGEGSREGRERHDGEAMSYAQAACKAEQEDVMKRANDRTKQIIVDNMEGSKGWKGLTEKELVEKAKMAKELMGIQGLDIPKVEFITAQKLRNGGVLYELNITDAAE